MGSTATEVHQLEPTPSKTPASWQTRVQAKKAECKSAIPPAWVISPSLLEGISLGAEATTNVIALDIPRKSGILSESELVITENYTAIQLLKKLADGSLTAVEVTAAFSKRAAIAQQLTSCLTEMFFERARERAVFLDDYLRKEGKPVGPLHGLPISLKDSFNYTGIQSTIGYVSFLDRPLPSKNSPLVDMLLDLGAVLYVKTNIPQTLMTADSDNNIFGRTLNPHNLSLMAGGSSGGEGALVAFRGSPVGIGTDIAGSIRIPSFCCGTYGFKPTTGRIPYAGQASPALAGLPGILPCAGPLSNSVDDLEMFTKAILGGKPWDYDSSAHAVPWLSLDDEAEATSKPLRIGVLTETKEYPLHPPIRRVLAETEAILAKAGHTMIPLSETPEINLKHALSLSWGMLSIDPLATGMQHIQDGGESIVPSVLQVISFYKPMMHVSKPDVSDIIEFSAMNAERSNIMDAWNRMWVANKLDAILSPVAQNTAVPHDTFACVPYTIIWNLLDYPACVIPYSKSSKELDPDKIQFEAPAAGTDYDPEKTDGAPCAIQVVTRRFQDEKCLYVAKVIDEALAAAAKTRSA